MLPMCMIVLVLWHAPQAQTSSGKEVGQHCRLRTEDSDKRSTTWGIPRARPCDSRKKKQGPFTSFSKGLVSRWYVIVSPNHCYRRWHEESPSSVHVASGDIGIAIDFTTGRLGKCFSLKANVNELCVEGSTNGNVNDFRPSKV